MVGVAERGNNAGTLLDSKGLVYINLGLYKCVHINEYITCVRILDII